MRFGSVCTWNIVYHDEHRDHMRHTMYEEQKACCLPETIACLAMRQTHHAHIFRLCYYYCVVRAVMEYKEQAHVDVEPIVSSSLSSPLH